MLANLLQKIFPKKAIQQVVRLSPKQGEHWEFIDHSGSPFTPKMTVEVLAIQEGWLQYGFLTEGGHLTACKSSLRIEDFVRMYRNKGHG